MVRIPSIIGIQPIAVSKMERDRPTVTSSGSRLGFGLAVMGLSIKT
jgi:hypothetical protein